MRIPKDTYHITHVNMTCTKGKVLLCAHDDTLLKLQVAAACIEGVCEALIMERRLYHVISALDPCLCVCVLASYVPVRAKKSCRRVAYLFTGPFLGSKNPSEPFFLTVIPFYF